MRYRSQVRDGSSDMQRAHSRAHPSGQAFGLRSSRCAQACRMIRTLLIFGAGLLLQGCSSAPVFVAQQAPAVTGGSQAPLVAARIGETVWVDGPKITPIAVLEDSRCAMNARCVWAGRVRIRVRVDFGSGSTTRELVQGEPVHVADGSLELVEVQPDRPAAGEAELADRDYRFGFRFMGGI